MSGKAILVEPTEKKKTVVTIVEFKVGGKTYEAVFAKPVDLKKIELPKGGKKKIDEGFANIAQKHGIKLYTVDAEGNKTLVKDPAEKILALAGKTYVKKTLVYSTIIKKK